MVAFYIFLQFFFLHFSLAHFASISNFSFFVLLLCISTFNFDFRSSYHWEPLNRLFTASLLCTLFFLFNIILLIFLVYSEGQVYNKIFFFYFFLFLSYCLFPWSIPKVKFTKNFYFSFIYFFYIHLQIYRLTFLHIYSISFPCPGQNRRASFYLYY